MQTFSKVPWRGHDELRKTSCKIIHLLASGANENLKKGLARAKSLKEQLFSLFSQIERRRNLKVGRE